MLEIHSAKVGDDMKYQETESVELKRILNDSFEKEVVAFLNTNDGVIYIGIDDDGTIVGVEQVDKVMKNIADVIADKILPNAQEFISPVAKYIDGKMIVEVNIKKGNSLYYIKKYGRSSTGCFIRIGTSSRRMTEEQIEREYKKKTISMLQIIEIPSTRKNLKFSYLKMLFQENGLSINDETFEENNKLRTEFGKYNIQAELLSDENDYSIKVVKFDGKTKASHITIRNEYGYKCLIVAMKNAFEYCQDVINQTKTIFKNGIREDLKLFDGDAFREAWFNACLHNDWVDGTPPAIYIFDDRMEIISTGGLSNNMSKKDFFSGISRPVNIVLTRIFTQLGLIEQTGHGVLLVAERYGKDSFEFLDNFLRVTIPFSYSLESNGTQVGTQDDTDVAQNDAHVAQNDTDVAQNDAHVAQNVAQNDTDVAQNDAYVAQNVAQTDIDVAQNVADKTDEEIIISAIKENNKITRVQLSKLIGKSKKTVERIIKESSKIVYVGSAKAGHWEIIE